MSIIGDNIKRARISKGITQAELAEWLGVSKATVSRYEKGTREPDYMTICRIVTRLHVPFEEIMSPSQMEWFDAGYIAASETSDDDNEPFDLQIFADEQSAGYGHLAELYDKLNADGQKVAIERVAELTEIPKYQRKPENEEDK